MVNKIKIVSSIKRRGYPTASRNYKEAHSEADTKEKQKYPKGYQKMKHIDSKLSTNELAGTHTKSGRVTISKKVPKRNRNEVTFHEREELKADKRLSKKR